MRSCTRFKLIPTVVEGPYIVRKAVGNKPALLGRKLNQRYFRGSGYVETDVGEFSRVPETRDNMCPTTHCRPNVSVFVKIRLKKNEKIFGVFSYFSQKSELLLFSIAEACLLQHTVDLLIVYL